MVDTTDKLDLQRPGYANGVISSAGGNSNTVDFQSFAFRGKFILMGSYYNNGPSNGPNITLYPPLTGTWCPGQFNDTPTFNGLLYIAGDLYKYNGTPPFYGSIDVEGDASHMSGNPKIYYRSDFNYSLAGSGNAAVIRWQERPASAFPTPLN